MKILKSQISSFIKLFSAAFLLSVIFVACRDQKTTGFESDPKDRGIMLTHIVPLKEAVDLYKDYGKNRIKPLKDSLKRKHGPDFNDTRLVSIDLATMKEYIHYVEERSKELKVTPEGLHFYFGVNSAKEKGKKKNHQTFFIAPSTSKDNVQAGYTLETKDDKVQIIYLKDVLKGAGYEGSPNKRTEKAAFFAKMLPPDDEGLLLNRGSNSPPDNDD